MALRAWQGSSAAAPGGQKFLGFGFSTSRPPLIQSVPSRTSRTGAENSGRVARSKKKYIGCTRTAMGVPSSGLMIVGTMPKS